MAFLYIGNVSEHCVVFSIILYYRVVENSPSHLAGLKPGDIVTHINGIPVHGTRDVYKMLEGAGDLSMRVVSHMTGQLMEVVVRPEDSR